MASQEAIAAQEGQEHFRRLGSAQYASAKQAMYQVAEVYLEEGRHQANAMMEQEQQLVSRYGHVLVSEARAYQTALTEGNAAKTLQTQSGTPTQVKTPTLLATHG
jgi:hypothetical protein